MNLRSDIGPLRCRQRLHWPRVTPQRSRAFVRLRMSFSCSRYFRAIQRASMLSIIGPKRADANNSSSTPNHHHI